jgi:class 3 adenylate cyclase
MIAAARIQRMTRLFGVRIIASDETFRQVREPLQSRELGSPRLKGLAHRSTLYEIQGRAGDAAGEDR